jgi:hemerythrin-like domain-containing protein
MLPIAPLMIEHRLIEKMVKLLSMELERLKAGGSINKELNQAAGDFFRVYADQTHHGKEEKILFRELREKEISAEHQEIMEQLIAEHVEARKYVEKLLSANTTDEVIDCLDFIVDLYPRHIAKEDKNFFIPVMEYFSDAEKDNMLQEGQEFDQTMIHEKYKAVVEKFNQE